MALAKSLIDTPLFAGAGPLSLPWILKFSEIGAASSLIAYGTRQQRETTDRGALQNGALWLETDTGLLYRVQFDTAQRLAAWVYVIGTLQRKQAQLATWKAGLGDPDDGLLVEVTDFRHVLRWSASAHSFVWGPGEDGRHDFVDLPVVPDDLTGWHLCDGSATTYLKGDGTTAAFTTPDLTAGSYRKGGAYTGTVTAAGATVTLSGNTDDEAAHTHSIDHDHGAFTSASNSTGQNLNTPNTGTGIAAGNGHTHSIDPPAFAGDSGAGAAHHHSLSAVTAALSGEVVANLAVPVYFRR